MGALGAAGILTPIAACTQSSAPTATASPSPSTSGAAQDAPTAVTSIAKDGKALVSWRAPVAAPRPTGYEIVPYIGGVAQPAQRVGDVTSAEVTGLVNGTEYTFGVKGTNALGDGVESVRSGANTPRAGLVFGDEFNGTVIDPEWHVYQRDGYQVQSEIQYYLPAQCVLDGAGHLTLTGTKSDYTGPTYPSNGGGTVTRRWRSGACQSNSRSYIPAAGNTMTFETRFSVCSGVAGGMWPGLLWLMGTLHQEDFKTDPDGGQGPWTLTTNAEIDIAEFGSPGQGTRDSTRYLSSVNTGGGWDTTEVTGIVGTDMHTYSVDWKPTSPKSLVWKMDGRTTKTVSGDSVPTGALFMMIYLQIIAGDASSPQVCTIDYVRVYDRAL